MLLNPCSRATAFLLCLVLPPSVFFGNKAAAAVSPVFCTPPRTSLALAGSAPSAVMSASADALESDGWKYGAVPELEVEPEVSADADDDDIALLVQHMMKAPAGSGTPGSAAASGPLTADGAPRSHLDVLPAVADDYIRNFLIRCNLRRSLDAFNTEWYELKAKGALPDDDVMSVPDIYAQHERLSDAVARLRVELGHAQEVASKAQQQWEKLRRERDFHRMHHKRVVQEKNRLVVDMKRLKVHFEGFEPTMRELRGKYEGAMRDKMLLKVERDKLAARVGALEAQVAAFEEDQGSSAAAPGGAARSAVGRGAGRVPALQTTALGRGRQAGAASAAAGRTAVGRPAAGVGAAAGGGRGSHSPAGKRSGQAGKLSGSEPAGPLPEDLPNPFAGLAFEPAHASAYAPALTVRAHGAAVTGVAFHPTKPVLATVSDDTTWRLWAMPEGELIMTGEGHRSWCADADFHPAGNHLATCSGDGIIKVWDLASAACSATLSDHTQTVWAVAWHASGDFLLSASMDHTCRLFDMAGGGGRVRQTLRGHVDAVNALAWQPFSAVVATASGDKTVSLWDTRTALCVQTFYGHANAVNDVAFNLQGDTLVSCDADGSVRMWDVRMVVERAQGTALKGSPANCVSLDRSGACIAVGCEDATVRVLDAASLTQSQAAGGPPVALKTLVELKGHGDSVQAVAFDPTSSYLLSAGNDCSVRCWGEGGKLPELRTASAVGGHATGVGVGDDAAGGGY